MNNHFDSSIVFDELFKNEVIYVVDKKYNVVFASEGAIDLFREYNSSKESPIDTKCYMAFKKKDKPCKNCRTNSISGNEANQSYTMWDTETERSRQHIVCKRYTKDNNTYIIHHLYDLELLNWMEEYSQKIIDNSVESIVVTDLNGIVISINPAFERKMGYTAKDVEGKKNNIFYLNPGDADYVTNHVRNNGKIENYTVAVITKYNRKRCIEINAWIIDKGKKKVILRVSRFLESAEILKSIIKITQNVLLTLEPGNLNIIVEETAKLLNSEYCAIYLTSNNEKELVLQAAFDSDYFEKAKDIIYKLNWNPKTNDEFDGITSWVATRRRVFEANDWNDIIKHPAHKGKLEKIYSDDFGSDFKNMYAIPLILKDKVKGVFRIENKIETNKYSEVDKEIFELMGKYIMLFLEEQKQLRKAVLAHIAHMTRSPIAEAIMNLSLFSNKEILAKMSNHEFSEAMRIIKNAMMQANITTTNLIIWSLDIDMTKGEWSSKKSIKIRNIVTKLTRSFESFTTDVKFNINMKGNLFLSVSEITKLEIILQNVIHNSIKYSRNEKIVENIDISGKRTDGSYLIRIRDYGEGMSKKDLENIWQEFHKGESSKIDRLKYGSVRGLGIGLASIKKICSETGWQPDLESKLGRGTTFSLKIQMEEFDYEQ